MQKKLRFVLNNEEISGEFNTSSTLLSYIRETKKLTGTKLVCREGDCGACTVLVGELQDGKVKYRAITSCIYPLAKVNGKHIVTIEGINQAELTPVQSEFINEGATQCGFCTPGFIMSLTWYLITRKNYSIDEAINALGGNICRCTGYSSIIRSTENIINKLKNGDNGAGITLERLIELNVLPGYFGGIAGRLNKIRQQIPKENKPFENAVIVGGGTDLYVQRFTELTTSDIFLSENLLDNYIKVENGFIKLSGSTTFEQFKNSGMIKEHFPELTKQIDLIASLPIRNSATIAGNIVNASPIGDMTIILIALNAELILSTGNKERTVKLRDFYKGYKRLNKNEDEFIKEIKIPATVNGVKLNFEKVSKRTYLDIASVNSAMAIKEENGRIISCDISAGGVAPVPLYLKHTSEYFADKEINSEVIESSLETVQREITPISDVRGSEEYKRLLLNQLIKAHFLKLFPDKINVVELI